VPDGSSPDDGVAASADTDLGLTDGVMTDDGSLAMAPVLPSEAPVAVETAPPCPAPPPVDDSTADESSRSTAPARKEAGGATALGTPTPAASPAGTAEVSAPAEAPVIADGAAAWPPVQPSPPPRPVLPQVPACPPSTTSGGTVFSGTGQNDELGSLLGIMNVEAAPALVRGLIGSAAGFTGHVIGAVEDAGPRPD
jgi:hypothetical protein